MISNIRIVATIGPISANEKALRSFYKSGMNVARLNGSHNTLSWHRSTIRLIRRILPKVPIILDIPGNVIECGIFFGGGLMTSAHLSSIFESINFERKIIGFDTFKGLTELSKFDSKSSPLAKKGAFAANSFDDLQKCIKLYDSNRFLNHLEKIQIIRGNAVKTIPKFLKDNPQTIISLLNLDFLLYEPSKIALENFVPRMPKNSIIAFNTLTDAKWPGTMHAVKDTLGIKNREFKRFSFNPYIQYLVL